MNWVNLRCQTALCDGCIALGSECPLSRVGTNFDGQYLQSLVSFSVVTALQRRGWGPTNEPLSNATATIFNAYYLTLETRKVYPFLVEELAKLVAY